MGMSVKRIIKHSCGHEQTHEFVDETRANVMERLIVNVPRYQCRREKRMVSMPE